MASSITKKLAAIFMLGLLGLAGLGYLYYKDDPFQGLLQGSSHSYLSFLNAISNLRSSLSDIEASELGFALSGDPTYLTGLETVTAAVQGDLNELTRLSGASSGGTEKIRHVEQLISRRLQYTNQLIAARAGKNGAGSAAALLQSGTAKNLSRDIGAVLKDLEQDWLTASLHEDRAREQGLKEGFSLVTIGYGASLFILLLTIAIVTREYTRSRKANRDPQALKERSEFFPGFKDTAQIMLAPDGTFLSWNADAERLLGFTEQEMIGQHFSVCFSDEEVKLGKPERCLRTAASEGRFEEVCSRRRKDGSSMHAHSIFSPVRDDDGLLRGFSVLTRDVTDRKHTEDLIKKLSMTVEQAGDLVVIMDRTGRVEYVNRAVEAVTGFTQDEFMTGGMGLLQIEKQDPGRYGALWDTALSGTAYHAEVTAVGKNEELIFLDQVVTPIRDAGGHVTHVVFTGSDLTPVKKMRERLDYLVSYDTLTGLPNRNLFAERLNRELSGDAAGRKPLAVLTIDIDRFKYLNEIYGIEAGNSVLKQVAESLSVSVNKGDIVGRLGSDEFGIVLHDVAKPADAVLFIKMIMKNVPQIVMSGGREIAVTLAIGIAVYPSDGTDAHTLTKNADTALAKAKGLGRNRYQFYSPDMNEGISELVFMERRLSDALKNKEYVLAYQPYYHLITKKVAGAEALLRWNNEEFGVVSPAKFIPMLEETGMITDVGSWVLRTACRQIKEWTNGKGRLPISVNLSPSQFRHDYLVETVANTVREMGIDPRRLVLEITESIFMKDQDFAVSVLRRLKSIGVAISIDDFGTGYSSLSYLKKFPVDSIKIDQSFVRDVATDPDTTSLVTAIISMAHSLNLKAIAEGVETEEQWKILRLLKCDMGQGFYFSLAVPPKEFEQLVV
jgi:diguanylate cyclase (GGDEF)-like protein/PAS domain S-box-containing protein